jgi:hypothetical protein
VGREIIRYYTHLSERMAGIARGADLSMDAVMELFLAGTGSGARRFGLLTATVAALGGGGEATGPLLARGLAVTRDGRPQWIVRKSRPEVGFCSVEVTLPWLASAVAGVNEEGVAVTLAPLAAAPVQDGGQGVSANVALPRAELLAQECLQRFADLGACIDWCTKRPAAGEMALILSDASGAMAAVELRGEERRIVGPGEGVLAHAARGDLPQELRAWRGASGGSRLDNLAGALSSPTGGLVVLDSEERTLAIALRREQGTGPSLGLVRL